MLLAVDIGNTNVVVGIYEGDAILTSWRLATERTRMTDEWWAIFSTLAVSDHVDLHRLDGAILASVVPRLTPIFIELCRERLQREPIVVDARLDFGIEVEITNPAEVGADRLANSVAAFTRYGGPVVVVDFGTGTNFDVVSEKGNYIGGAIAPGLTLALEALTSRAARLSAVELAVPERAIGRDTFASVQSGTVLGYIGLIEGLLTRIANELGTRPAVVATGGLGGVIAPHTSAIDAYEPDLTLDGLRIIFERVQQRNGNQRRT
ncbi:MAG TPA: type III pantothenate kinase [Nitrolancea sp.]|nr:type III pantothenate kinase [Nitrolancea sp.]